jgi:hypothetical protein
MHREKRESFIKLSRKKDSPRGEIFFGREEVSIAKEEKTD